MTRLGFGKWHEWSMLVSYLGVMNASYSHALLFISIRWVPYLSWWKIYIYICCNVTLEGCWLLGKFKCRYYTFLYEFYDGMLWLRNWNQVGSWMAWGWTNECFWGSLWSVFCEDVAWVVIDCNCVDCEAMCSPLNYFCQVELWSVWMYYVWNPYPSWQ